MMPLYEVLEWRNDVLGSLNVLVIQGCLITEECPAQTLHDCFMVSLIYWAERCFVHPPESTGAIRKGEDMGSVS